MTKIFKILLVLALIQLTMQQNCSNPLLNRWLSPFAPSSHLTTPAVITGLDVCKQYEGKEICCDIAQVAEIKAYYQGIKDKLLSESTKSSQMYSEVLLNAVKNKNRIILAFHQMSGLLKSSQTMFAGMNSQMQAGLDTITQQLTSMSDMATSIIPSTFDTSMFPDSIKGILDMAVSSSDTTMINSQLSMIKATLSASSISQISGMASSKIANATSQAANAQTGTADANIQSISDMIFTQMSQDQISQEILDMQGRVKNLTVSKGKCYSSLLKHLAGVLCLSCDPDWESKGLKEIDNTYSSSYVSMKLNQTLLTGLVSDCYGYFADRVEMNKNQMLQVDLQTIQTLNASLLTTNVSDPAAMMAFMADRVTQWNSNMQAMITYSMPWNCYSSDQCDYILYNVLTPFGFNLYNLNDKLQSNMNLQIPSIPGGLLRRNRRSLVSRLLQFSYYSQFDDSTNMMYGITFDNSIANDSNITDTMAAGESGFNAADLVIDVTAGVTIFNQTGNETDANTVDNVPMPDGLGVKSNLPLLNETSLSDLAQLAAQGAVTGADSLSTIATSTILSSSSSSTDTTATIGDFNVDFSALNTTGNSAQCVTINGKLYCHAAVLKNLLMTLSAVVLCLTYLFH